MQRSTTIVLSAGTLFAGAGLYYYGVRRQQRHRRRVTDDDRNLRADLPGLEREITTADGASLTTSQSGDPDGPTVVLAHCWTGSRQTWTPVARRLVRAGCNVIRWDHREHAHSTAGSHGCTIKALGQDMATVMEAYDVADAVVVGHSMGGMTVMEYAIDYKEDFDRRTKAVVLVDTAAFGMDSPVMNIAPDVLGKVWLDSWARHPEYGRFIVRHTFGTWAPPEALQLAIEDFTNTTFRGRTEFAAEFPELDLRDGIAQIDRPTTILVGSSDTLTPVVLGQAMHELIPGSTLRTFPHMGHMMPVEDPAGVTDAILAAVASRTPRLPDQRSKSVERQSEVSG